MNSLETSRLIIRPWRDDDRPAFALMSADPQSMQYLGGVWDRATSDNFIDRCMMHAADYGYGIWAIVLKDGSEKNDGEKNDGEFIGFAGLKNVSFTAHFTPAVEIGWRLARPHWHKGYATEAATKILEYGFADLGLTEIISYVTPANKASVRVIEKLGMIKEAKSFHHPYMQEADPLSEMLLFRLKNNDFTSRPSDN